MARSINVVMLLGNLGNDPEVRSTPGGARVATFSLATSRQWNNAAGEKQEKTEWHRCQVWGKLADVVEQYVKKGDKIHVTGRIEYRQWQDKEGQTRYSTEINISEMVMLGGAPKAPGGNGTTRAVRQETQKVAAGVDDFDVFPAALADETDDLPF